MKNQVKVVKEYLAQVESFSAGVAALVPSRCFVRGVPKPN